MNVSDYLKRIDYHGPVEPVLPMLTGLHQVGGHHGRG